MTEPATGRRVYRTRTSIIVCGAWALVTLYWLVMELISGLAGTVRSLPAIAAASLIVFALFGRPRVEVHADRVGLIGVIRDVWIPYAALAEVADRFSLTLVDTDGRNYPAWAAPVGRKSPHIAVTADRMRRPAEHDDDDGIARNLSPGAPGAARLAVLAAWRAALTGPGHSAETGIDTPGRTWTAGLVVRTAWVLPALAGSAILIAIAVGVFG